MKRNFNDDGLPAVKRIARYSKVATLLIVVSVLWALISLRGDSGGECPIPNPITDLSIDRHLLQVELASTPAARQCGLSSRDQLSADSGMLFVFPTPAVQHFWMNNTRLPLDLAFVDATGRISSITTMSPENPERVFSSPAAVRFAIEANAGWFSRHAITPGGLVTFALPDDLVVR